MNRRFRDLVLMVVTTVSVMVAPFLLGACSVVIGIGIYRMFQPGPAAISPGFAVGWGISSAAWPLFSVTVALTVGGLWTFRTLSRTRSATRTEAVPPV
jgi:hypothetical protein